MYSANEKIGKYESQYKQIKNKKFIGGRSKSFKNLSISTTHSYLSVSDIKIHNMADVDKRNHNKMEISQFICQKINFAEDDRLEYPCLVFKSNKDTFNN